MEQLSGAQGWSRIGYLPRPGHIRLWTHQAVARGAEAIVYFRFRAAHFGTEEFCHGIIDHDGKPKRKFDEVQGVMKELATHGDMINAAEYKADVAVYYDQENLWAWTHQPHSDAFNFKQEFVRFYGAAVRQGVNTDIVFPGDALDKYKLVVVPLYFLGNDTFDKSLIDYIENGGHVIFTYRTGVKDPINRCHADTLPGKFATYAGIEIDEYESLQAVQSNQVRLGDYVSEANIWCDLITPKGADVLATYEQAFYKGTAAVTRHTYKGDVTYIGSSVDDTMLDTIYNEALTRAGIDATRLPDDVEKVDRHGDGHVIRFYMNHSTDVTSTVEIGDEWQTLDGDAVSGTLELKPLDVIMLKREVGA